VRLERVEAVVGANEDATFDRDGRHEASNPPHEVAPEPPAKMGSPVSAFQACLWW